MLLLSTPLSFPRLGFRKYRRRSWCPELASTPHFWRSAIHVSTDLIPVTPFEYAKIAHSSHGGSRGMGTAFELEKRTRSHSQTGGLSLKEQGDYPCNQNRHQENTTARMKRSARNKAAVSFVLAWAT